MDSALESRLRDLLDRDAIRQVVERNARSLDRCDVELGLSCYWPEAIDDHNHFIGGPQGFLAYAHGVSRAFESCQHTVGTHTCELAGDEAHCETYYIFTAHAAQAPHFMATGRYVDHFEKRGGEWRIRNRVCIVDGQYELLPSAMGQGDAYPPGEKPVARDRSDVSYQRPLQVRQQPKG
ncbi:nuclear transport factor 2 family protein [Novosphingobium sp. TH158]|uniref:nuclear transport factor 2 family protein n=1 Tax=Novosphingobium sp. TH158 TaxID=2067455 RepID=UPI0013044F2F|nr:nuclear transport factor 2 family protein [Novosphingobium sp. TH158]